MSLLVEAVKVNFIVGSVGEGSLREVQGVSKSTDCILKREVLKGDLVSCNENLIAINAA